ncbi:ferric-rhodotorulic acid outer membrane transporter [Salmonella enterica subsp. enterica]|uniref:Ferric-rhodotorulic acid outer membrane transporter n=1 Tax=Salmonella enterica I TaxID=59201 RepID=A0A447MU43_SALET|nr:ferric-rhodotorulic acid outer membrane transporter [Salmonella enterica subsp. enterica]
MFGGSYSKQNNRYFSAWANVFPDDIGNFSAFNGNFPKTHWAPQNLAQDDTTHMNRCMPLRAFRWPTRCI